MLSEGQTAIVEEGEVDEITEKEEPDVKPTGLTLISQSPSKYIIDLSEPSGMGPYPLVPITKGQQERLDAIAADLKVTTDFPGMY